MDPAQAPLDERKQRILRAVVEAYVRMGEPVGSRTVSEDADLGVSSATIRNEMGILEREGYIGQPHTSAGRVPTDKGYRYYVDVLSGPAQVSPEHRKEIERNLEGTLSALDDLLERASGLLTEMTEYTGLASAPPMTETRLRHVELVPLGGRRVFVIFVGEGASHDERVLELSSDPSPESLRRTADRASRAVSGLGPTEAAGRLDALTDGDDAAIMRSLAATLRILAGRRGRLFTGGASRMIAWEPGPSAQRILEALEGGTVGPLLPDTAPERIDIRIGRELHLEDLHDLSLIAAGYELGTQGAGLLGVLGPTRMDYPTVIATVALVARSVSRALRRLESS